MLRAIDEYKITGVKNTLQFGAFVFTHPDFISGKFDTHFVAKHFKPEYLKRENEAEIEIAALLAAYVFESKGKVSQKSNNTVGAESSSKSNWVRNRTLN
jgi:acetyl/propionyl-CoA carboxylase alpha subunit